VRIVAREVEAWRVNQTDLVRITCELCLPSNMTRTGRTHGRNRDRQTDAGLLHFLARYALPHSRDNALITVLLYLGTLTMIVMIYGCYVDILSR